MAWPGRWSHPSRVQWRRVAGRSGSRAGISTSWTGAAPAPTYDPVESVDFLAVPDGAGWRAIYLDTPTSLTPKLRLANDRGLAGAGFWAIGYERGLPEYTRLIERFRADRLPAVETAAESTPGFAAPTLPAAPSP